MRKLFLIITGILLCTVVARAQEIIQPQEVRLVPNTVGTPSLSIEFILDMGEKEIDTDYWLDVAKRPRFSLLYADKKNHDCDLKAALFTRANGFGVEITGFNNDLLDRFLNKDKDNQITVVFDSDVQIGLLAAAGDSTATTWVIKKEDVNALISNSLQVTDDQRTGFLTSLNNFFYYENFVDFGVQPAQDSVKTSYVLTLRFQNLYNKSRFLSCAKTPGRNAPALYWNIDTRLSTNFRDSLNFINVYPVNVLWENYTGKLPFQLRFKLGNESDQVFENKRAAINGEFNCIIPNFINLTTAKSNRLRLKPTVALGLKGYYDYSNDIDAFASGQAFLKGRYYIPVFNNYAIIVDGISFFDFSKERNPDQRLKGNYSVTLGAEIPKTGFKAMFKYADGETDINFRKGAIVSIGLLMDFFQEKK